MNERKTGGLSLDPEDYEALGYGGADINSPLEQPQGQSVSRKSSYTPSQRGGSIPLYVVPDGGMETLERLAEQQAAGAEPLRDADVWRQLENAARAIGDVPVAEYTVPSNLSRVMAKQLAVRLLAVAKGHPWPAKQELALRAIYKKVFNAPADRVWIVPFMQALRKAALQRLNWERRIAKLEEQEREQFTEPPQLLEHAEQVLDSTQRIVERWPGNHSLPKWLTAHLVAYFIPRVGFSKGGGARRVLSDESFVRLLAEPMRLIKDLKHAGGWEEQWRDAIELLRQEVAKARPKGSRVRRAQAPAGMPGQGAAARSVPKA